MKNEWIRLIATGGFLGLTGLSFGDGTVTGLTEQHVAGGVQLVVQGTGLSQPKELRVLGGKAYIAEFDAKLLGKPKSLKINHDGVTSARAGWYTSSPAKVRVMVRLQPGEKPVLTGGPSGYTISINVPESTVIVKTTTDVKSSQAQADPDVKQPMDVKPIARTPVEPMVSLDFVSTDCVQILKALALQADVNIITAPEVAGRKVTVSLDHVHVKDALDFVTALAGLRYARVQDSYVVTTRERFGSIMTDLADRTKQQNVIRIVPIISGDGPGIKNALAKWFGPTTLQVLLPGDPAASGSGSAAGASPDQAPAGGQGAPPIAPAGAGGGAPGGAAPADTSGGKADTSKDSTPYLLLIGDKKWVDQAETLIKQLDADVIEATTATMHAHRAALEAEGQEREFYAEQMSKAKASNTSQSTYVVQNGTAVDLKSSISDQIKTDGLSVVASPRNSNLQTLIVSGNPSLVENTIATLRQLDTGASTGDDTLLYEIKYADPRSLQESVKANIPGIIVTLPPSSAGNPRLYHKGEAGLQAFNPTDSTNGANGQNGGANGGAQAGGAAGAAAGGATAGGAAAKGDQGQVNGLQQPFIDMEPFAPAMRLLLKGSKRQISDALAYIDKVDVAPRQLALEMRVMELSKEDALKLGINWSSLTGGTVTAVQLNQSQNGIGTNSAPANTVTGRLGFNKGSAGVTASLDAIANKNNLIARPNILALDGREAEIFVGDIIQYVQSIQASQNGTTVQTAQLPVGVRLAVLSRIGGNGSITMDIRPVVSFLKGFTAVPGGGSLPQSSLRISENTVNVQSGETIAIGGLIQDQDLYNIQKVPLLGDLPILGHLFRQTTHDRQRTEVVFFLTVKEVKPGDRMSAADPIPVEKAHPAERPIPYRDLLK